MFAQRIKNIHELVFFKYVCFEHLFSRQPSCLSNNSFVIAMRFYTNYHSNHIGMVHTQDSSCRNKHTV